MSLKNRILTNIINREKDFVNHPDDSGGPTRFGITEAVARLHGYEGDMRNFPIEMALSIYAGRYWHSVGGDFLAALSESVAAEVVDTGVNCSPREASKMLQRALNVLNLKGELYDDLDPDGIVGSRTIAALEAYLQRREESTLVKMLNVLQGAFYIELAERRQKDESFIYGWFNHRVKL